MHFRTVVSLFDGMECGRIALDKNGDTYDHYYASEIDKFAVAESSANYPDTIHVGDVTKWRKWNIDWTQVDLVIGGSPCQGFSFAGKQLAFDDPRSKLFFEFVKIVNAAKFFNPNVNFLLENVKMKKDHLEVITEYMGVEPVFINSALVCAQNRRRYYWCNWPVRQPEDRGIILVDILQTDGEGVIKHHCKWVDRNEKSQCVDANYHKGVDNHGQRTMIGPLSHLKPRGNNPGGLRGLDGESPAMTSNAWQENVKVVVRDKSRTVRASGHGSYERHEWDSIDDTHYRKLTVVECCRLQGVPDDYFKVSSNTQCYKMLGNGWQVDTIVHLLKELNNGF